MRPITPCDLIHIIVSYNTTTTTKQPSLIRIECVPFQPFVMTRNGQYLNIFQYLKMYF